MKTYTCIEGRLYSQEPQSAAQTDIHRQCPDCNGAGCGERGEAVSKIQSDAVLQDA